MEETARLFRESLSLDPLIEEVAIVDPKESVVDGVVDRMGFDRR